MTSCVAEMRNERLTFLFGHVKFLCKTRKTEKFRRTAIDELFGQPDLIARQLPPAGFAMLHQSLTTFARKILQPCDSIVGL